MEYVQGQSLLQFLKAKPQRRAKEEEAKKIFFCVTQSIQYCHSKNVTHRDVKLENILLNKDMSPMLIDFGFSTCMPSEQKVKMFCGTPSYMAPEIVNKVEYRGPPADCWALGILLYVLLCGQFPFKGTLLNQLNSNYLFLKTQKGNNDADLYAKINKGKYILHDHLSNGSKNLISFILKVQPEDRPTCD